MSAVNKQDLMDQAGTLATEITALRKAFGIDTLDRYGKPRTDIIDELAPNTSILSEHFTTDSFPFDKAWERLKELKNSFKKAFVRAGLVDRVALITDATGDMGRAIAKAYAEAGMNLVLLGRDKEALSALAEELDPFGTEIMTIPCDFTNPSGVFMDRDIQRPISRRFGRLDVFVANYEPPETVAPVSIMDTVKMETAIDMNPMAHMYLLRALYPSLHQSTAPRVIFSAPLLCEENDTKSDWTAYDTSKAAFAALAQGFCNEHNDSDINVNCVDPGYINDTVLSKVRGKSLQDIDDMTAPYLEFASAHSSIHHHRSNIRHGMLKDTYSIWTAPLNDRGSQNEYTAAFSKGRAANVMGYSLEITEKWDTPWVKHSL